MSRPNKSEYYIDIARSVARRSTCMRRRFGAVIVKSRLYPRAPRADYEEHFSADVFGVSVPCGEAERGEVIELLSTSGASDIREI